MVILNKKQINKMVAMNEAIETGRIKDCDTILLSAFGAGFTWGSMLLKWEGF